MIINKITYGFVVQQWDTEKKQWVGQDFVAGDVAEFEDETGDMIDDAEMEEIESKPALSFKMVQPENEAKA